MKTSADELDVEADSQSATRIGMVLDASVRQLRQMAAVQPPGNKLPTVLKLAEILGASPVTVQRAVKALCKEGVIETRRGNGIFVAGTSHSGSEYLGAMCPVQHISVRTDSVAPFQMAFWTRAIKDFERIHGTISIGISKGPGVPLDAGADAAIREVALPMHRRFMPDEMPFLNLEEILGKSNTQPHLDAAFPPCSRYFAPYGISVPCLIYSPDHLRQLGLSEPEFSTFREQRDYVRAVVDTIKASKRPDVVPILRAASGTLMAGALIRRVADWITGKQPLPEAERKELEGAFDEVLSLCRQMESYHRARPRMPEALVDGRYAFVLGHQHDGLGLAKAAAPGTEWKARPWFGPDDRVYGILRSLVVLKNTANPIECARFVAHLQTPRMQRLLVETGCLPALAEEWKISPGSALDFPDGIWSGLRERIALWYPADRTEAYLTDSILDVEINSSTVTGAGGEEVLRNVYNFGRAYLNHCLPS